jgi:hypothetical protein
MATDTDRARAFLDDFRRRGEVFGEYSAPDIDRLLAAVEAVLKRHEPTGAFPPGEDICPECSGESLIGVPWPCPTVTAITRELLGEGDGRGRD